MRVSPIMLVIFVVLAIFCLVGAYAFYSQETGSEAELATNAEKLAAQDKKLQDLNQEYKDLLSATGYTLPALKTLAGGTDNQPAQKLDDILKTKLATRDNLVKEIGVAITDVDADGNSAYLQKTIEAALAPGGTTPEGLSGTLVGQIIDKLREAAKNRTEHEKVIADGKANLKQLDEQIVAKDKEVDDAIAKWDADINAKWEARMAAQTTLISERKVQSAEEAELSGKLAVDKAISAKVEARDAAQKNRVSPADGRIVAYDWRHKIGTISLGAKDGVKAGYQFDVFRRYPGPDTLDRRTYLAKIVLTDVKPNVSLFMIVPSEFDKAGLAMTRGDLVMNPVFSETRAKRFYVAGYFPRGADYDRASIVGLIKRSGGTVVDELTLDVDYVIVGVTNAGEKTDWNEEAKAGIAKAKADFDLAQKYAIEVLTVDKFLSLIQSK